MHHPSDKPGPRESLAASLVLGGVPTQVVAGVGRRPELVAVTAVNLPIVAAPELSRPANDQREASRHQPFAGEPTRFARRLTLVWSVNSGWLQRRLRDTRRPLNEPSAWALRFMWSPQMP